VVGVYENRVEEGKREEERKREEKMYGKSEITMSFGKKSLP